MDHEYGISTQYPFLTLQAWTYQSRDVMPTHALSYQRRYVYFEVDLDKNNNLAPEEHYFHWTYDTYNPHRYN